jgi:hypothetical protein
MPVLSTYAKLSPAENRYIGSRPTALRHAAVEFRGSVFLSVILCRNKQESVLVAVENFSVRGKLPMPINLKSEGQLHA